MVQDVIHGVLTGHKFQNSSSCRRAVGTTYLPTNLSSSEQTLPLNPSNVKSSTSSNRVMVILNIHKRPNWVFSSEAGAWKRILMNLFGNALKYTDHGFIKISLQSEDIPASTTNDAHSVVTLIVRDSGRGMSKDYLKHYLFTPFAQEDSLSPGAGLGLSIVQQIVLGLGGNIHVESEIAIGTIIKVSVPLVAPGVSAELADKDDTEFISKVREQTTGLIFSPLAIQSPPNGTAPSSGLSRLHITRMMDLKLSVDRLATDWFGMTVADSFSLESADGDIVITTPTELQFYLQKSAGSPTAAWDITSTPLIVLLTDADDPVYSLPPSWGKRRVVAITLP